MDSHHGNLDNIGGSALHGCVHGVAFGKSTDGSVVRDYIRQVTFAAEQRFDIQVFARKLLLRLDERTDLRERGKVVVNQLFGFGARAIELLRQAESGYTVQDTEVSRLGGTALLFADLIDRHLEDLCRRGSVDILPVAEGVQQMFVLREVCH